MKSPPKLSVGFTYFYLFDSIFKEYSDPNYPRSDVTKAMWPVLRRNVCDGYRPLSEKHSLLSRIGALQPPTLGYAQAESLL